MDIELAGVDRDKGSPGNNLPILKNDVKEQPSDAENWNKSI